MPFSDVGHHSLANPDSAGVSLNCPIHERYSRNRIEVRRIEPGLAAKPLRLYPLESDFVVASRPGGWMMNNSRDIPGTFGLAAPSGMAGQGYRT